MTDLVPLRHTLPNPPPGAYRDPELVDAVRAHLGHAPSPLTLITGPAGAGRSCMVMMALRDWTRRPLYVALDPRSQDDIILCLHRVMCGQESTSGGEPRELLMDVLERCEQLAICVVVDAPWQTVALHGLIDVVTRYVRTSRWIVVLDTLPWQAHTFDVLHIPAPTEKEREQWLAMIAPHMSQESRTALLDEHTNATLSELERVLESLHAPAASMSPHHLTLCAELLALCAPSQEYVAAHASAGALWRELEVAGMIYRRDATRWHVTRHVLDALATRPTTSATGPLESALQAEIDVASTGFACFELSLARGDVQGALELLARHFEAWVELGLLSILWGHLNGKHMMQSRDLDVERDRMRCALIMNDPVWLDALCEPLGSSAETQLLWMSVVVTRGQIARARAILDTYGDALGETRAALYEVALLMVEGRFDRVVTCCEMLAVQEATHQLWLDSVKVLALTWEQRKDEALDHAMHLRRQLGHPQQRHPMHRHAWVNLARTLHLCERLDLARHALDQVATYSIQHDDLFLCFHSQASVEYLDALLSVEFMERERAERALDTLAVRYPPEDSLGFHIQQLLVAIAMLHDDYDEVERRYTHAQRMQFEQEPWNVLHIYYARARARQKGFAHVEPLSAPGRASHHTLRFDMERALRLGGEPGLAALCARHDEALVGPALAEGRFIDVLRARERGEPLRACLEAHYERALTHGCLKSQITTERQMALCALLEQRPDVIEVWRDVARVAKEYDNKVWSVGAQWVIAVMEGACMGRDLLAWFGRLPESLFTRLCAGLLGATLEDRFEQACVARLRSYLPWRIQRAPDQEALPVLWLDLAGGVLYSRGSQVRMPAKGAQRDLLELLATRPEHVYTKQELLSEVWGIEDFHPLEHENRLRMAVFKLRKTLASLPEVTSPEHCFIVTCEEGYTLSSDVAIFDVDNLSLSPG